MEGCQISRAWNSLSLSWFPFIVSPLTRMAPTWRSSFCDSFFDINHSLCLMSCMWLTALSSCTVKHKPVKAAHWQNQEKPLSVTFLCACICNRMFVQDVAAWILYFPLLTFTILSIIICAVWAELPLSRLCTADWSLGWWESAQHTNTQTKGDMLEKAHSDGERQHRSNRCSVSWGKQGVS